MMGLLGDLDKNWFAIFKSLTTLRMISLDASLGTARERLDADGTAPVFLIGLKSGGGPYPQDRADEKCHGVSPGRQGHHRGKGHGAERKEGQTVHLGP